MNQGICYVVGAGEFHHDPILPTNHDMVIAADGGYLHLRNQGVKPNAVLGDFDSFPYEEGLPGVVKYPKEKDDTDMGLAVNMGLQYGFQTFVIYGGTGGRMDHTFANLQILCKLSNHNAIGYLIGKEHVATMITNDSLMIPGIEDIPKDYALWLPTQRGYVSVFSFTETAKNVTLEGLKYNLNRATLKNDEPIGVSNEFTGHPALIAVEEGTLLIFWEKN